MNTKKIIKKSLIIGGLSAMIGYLSFCAPAIPFAIKDMKHKYDCGYYSSLGKKKTFEDISKTIYGAMAWYPKDKFQGMMDGKDDYLFIVNKNTQQLFMYDGDLDFVDVASVSTGRDHTATKKSSLDQKATPTGTYIAVKIYDKNELQDWFGVERQPYYGEGMVLFMGESFPHIAIHGTNSESYLSQPVSKGCARTDKKTIEYIVENARAGSELLVQDLGAHPILIENAQQKKEFLSVALQNEKWYSYNNPQLTSLEDVKLGDYVFMKK